MALLTHYHRLKVISLNNDRRLSTCSMLQNTWHA